MYNLDRIDGDKIYKFPTNYDNDKFYLYHDEFVHDLTYRIWH